MIRFGVLLAVVLTATGDNEEEFKKCIEVLHSPTQCCKKPFVNINEMDCNNFKECKHIPLAPGSCDRYLCIGTKSGIATDDGTIKMDVVKQNLEKRFAEQPEILKIVKERCINGDWQDYGAADDCDISKIINCIGWHVKFNCQDFNDEGPCKGSKDKASKCLELNHLKSL